MFKTLFGEKYSKAFLDRVEWRKKEYYEKRRIQTIRNNAAKMAMNWTHEYPTGTPLGYIRDDIIEMWERSEGVGIFSNLDKEQNIPVPHDTKEAFSTMQAVQTMAEPVRGTRKDPKAQATIKKYKHEWRNPPDEGNND
jgi:hypothetical protein